MKLPQLALEHAKAAYPQESGGFLVLVGGVPTYIPATNAAANPMQEFRVLPAERLSAEELGELVGYVHSHPDESDEPSPADLLQHDETGLWDFIISVVRGEVASVRAIPPGREAKRPLLGRKFTHAVDDCYSIIRDYYRRYEGIALPDFHRPDLWWEKGLNLYRDYLPLAGFREIDRSQLLPGDLILMRILSPVENHAVVWLGDGVIIHHLYGQISMTDDYKPAYVERTASFWQHREKGRPRWETWQQVW